MFFFLYAYCYYFGGYLRWNGVKNGDKEYTGGMIITIMLVVTIGALNLGSSGPFIRAIQEGRVAGALAFETIDHVPDVNSREKGKSKVEKSTLKGELKFNNVNFTYPSRQDLQVLKDFSVTFEAGKTTALVGPSGCGKSTLIQLLERFYDPDSGSVTLDGADYKDLDITSIRQSIGFVSQEPVLFNTTILENLKFAQPEATEAECIQALKDANAWNFIKEM